MSIKNNLDFESIVFHNTKRGLMAHFAADQCIGQALNRYGEWAEDEINLLRGYVEENATVVDVGANVGVHSLAFAEMVGPLGRVVAIEGSPETCMLLAHNVVANRLTRTVLVLGALAGSNSSIISYTPRPPSENVGAVSFVQNVHEPEALAKQSEGGLNISLPLIKIDSLNLDTCSLIKIDVEGMEEEVIQGSLETISRCKPVIYFEHSNSRVDSLVRLFSLFVKAKYRLYWHVANPYNSLNFKKDDENIFGGNVELNILALPDQYASSSLPEIFDPKSAAVIPTLAEALSGVAIAGL